VSTPEQISFATTYENTAATPVVVSARLFAGLSELARLNVASRPAKRRDPEACRTRPHVAPDRILPFAQLPLREGNDMLSPHELATLLLVKDAPGRIEADRAELGALRALELIANDLPEPGFPVPRVTPRGDAVLRAIARVR
jgi:hypothetical protein